jgi:hypothetical protein
MGSRLGRRFIGRSHAVHATFPLIMAWVGA